MAEAIRFRFLSQISWCMSFPAGLCVAAFVHSATVFAQQDGLTFNTELQVAATQSELDSEHESRSIASPISLDKRPESCDENEFEQLQNCDFSCKHSTLKNRLADRGINYSFYATQFYQGVTAGGREQDWEYGGKLDLLTNLDGQKVGLWQGFFIDAHLESRLGQSVNNVDGLIAPSNIAMAFPEMEGNVTALTGLKLTQALSEDFVVFAGKINTLDEFPIRYNSELGLGRPGLGGFMNTTLVFNPIAGRTVPYAAAGAGLALLREMQPFFSFTVFDPAERSTIGLQNLFERGVVLVPDFVFRTNFLSRPGTWNFGGTYSNSTYTSIDPASYLNLQSVTGTFPVETGSWSLYSNFFQSIWVDPCDEKRSWGVFGGLGLSDGNPNPIKYTLIAGVGGRVMRANRKLDTFGIGVFNLGLSSQFEALSSGTSPQHDEYGLEWFYNVALSKNIRLTGDLQVVRPSTVDLDTAVIPGLRLQASF